MNMIEKVANAISDKVMGDQSITDNCHAAAKAAIEAMKEPTEEMLKDSERYYNAWAYYQSMIDAALKE